MATNAAECGQPTNRVVVPPSSPSPPTQQAQVHIAGKPLKLESHALKIESIPPFSLADGYLPNSRPRQMWFVSIGFR
jgi:hypothetical protein